MNNSRDDKQVILNPTVQWVFTIAITVILGLIGWSVNSLERRAVERSQELERRILSLETDGPAIMREKMAEFKADIQAIRANQEIQNRLLMDLLNRERLNDSTSRKP